MVNILLKVKIPWIKTDEEQAKTYQEGTTLKTVLDELGIQSSAEGNYLIAVNGKIEYSSYVLNEGDEISILPALIGG
ncbi:MAG: MoaD/ThiS family protein [Bacillota bacterium]